MQALEGTNNAHRRKRYFVDDVEVRSPSPLPSQRMMKDGFHMYFSEHNAGVAALISELECSHVWWTKTAHGLERGPGVHTI